MTAERRQGDRRRPGIISSFPLLDNNLSIIRQDRRSNTDRRLNQAKLKWQESQPIVNLQVVVLNIGESLIEVASGSVDKLVGRAPPCEIILNNGYISHRHASFSWHNSEFLITDHSRNGTYVKTDDVGSVHLRNEYIFLTGEGSISFGVPHEYCQESLIMRYSCK